MFTNLIESDSHRKEFKRRSSFFLATVAAYGLLLSGAGVASIYAYDAHLEAQTSDRVLLNWVPPVTPVAPVQQHHNVQQPRRTAPSNAPVDPHITTPERINQISSVNDSREIPKEIGTVSSNIPPSFGKVKLTGRNVDPPGISTGFKDGCVTCSEPGNAVVKISEDPPPLPKTPAILNVSKGVLLSKILSMPKARLSQFGKTDKNSRLRNR